VIGTLRGFDEYVNMVLDDVTEYEITPTGRKEVINHTLATLICVFTH
jgi:small nuclear ribonucleoprotein (snRNP)-like protein